MKNNLIVRNLLFAVVFALATYTIASACPVGISGLSNPNSTVCAKDANGNLWCVKANANGYFNLIGATVSPSNINGCIPAHGQLTVYNYDCPGKGIVVDRSGPGYAGGSWLDVSCWWCVTPPSYGVNMKAWFALDEASGTKAGDLAQFGPKTINSTQFESPIDGIYYGSPQHLTGTAGWVSNAVKFDGINDYVEAPNHPSLNFGTGDFSIDAWVKIDHPNDALGVRVLVEKREQVGAQFFGYSFFLYNGKLSLQLADGGYANYVSNLTVPADGQWHLVAVTIDRSSASGGTFYLSQGTMWDFTVQTAIFNPANRQGSVSNSRPLRIGSLTLGGPNYLFKGSMDEVEIFNRMLTTEEIQSLATAGRYGKCKPCFICT
ncbi:MAG: LamG domain-containing protein [Blastocatellia bacterium]